MEQNILIRRAEQADIEEILPIFPKAREFMRANGNLTQWPDIYPGREDVEEDIENKRGYVMISDGKIGAYFALIIGRDPSYGEIDGAWLDDVMLYGTIHRLATDGSIKNCADNCFEYCWKICSDLRVDTHEDNKNMQEAILRNGFKRCGIIKLADNGEPRIAYQKLPAFLM